MLSNAGNRAALVLLLLLDRGVLGAAPAPPVSQQRDACLLQRPLTRNQHTQVKRGEKSNRLYEFDDCGTNAKLWQSG